MTSSLPQGENTIGRMCALAGVSRAGYYRHWAASAPRQHDTAIRDFDTAIRIEPNFGWGFFFRGNAYSRKGDYSHAIDDYDMAIKLVTDQSRADIGTAFFGRGVAYKHLGKRDLAERDFQQALALDAAAETKMSKLGIVR